MTDLQLIQQIRQTAETLAKQAGQFALAQWDMPLETHLKGYRDVVTAVDFAVQEMIVDGVRAQFPTHGFITEEKNTEDMVADITWIIDPIDGTSNYSRRLSNWCVSIGVAVNDVLTVGAVYDPVRDELFSAVAGHGATVNGTPIEVNDTRNPHDGIIAFDWSRGHEKRTQVHNALVRLKENSRSLRSFGSTALAVTWIAAGRIEGYFSLMPSAWDVAAAVLILQEAGGRTTSISGNSFDLNNPETYRLSSNGRVHSKLLTYLQSG